jgi:hypothetical protein
MLRSNRIQLSLQRLYLDDFSELIFRYHPVSHSGICTEVVWILLSKILLSKRYS